MACVRCGHCCTSVTLNMEGLSATDDELESYAQYLSYHHLVVIIKNKDGKKFLSVTVPTKCYHLQHDKRSGTVSCDIYEDRPLICQKYICPAAKGDDDAENHRD